MTMSLSYRLQQRAAVVERKARAALLSIENNPAEAKSHIAVLLREAWQLRHDLALAILLCRPIPGIAKAIAKTKPARGAA